MIDFEFLEDHKHVDPISLGMVRDDGKELYMVFSDMDTLSIARHGWLMQNVMPSIEHREYTSHVTGLGTPVKDLEILDENGVTKGEARMKILEFVEDIWPEFWAWYGSYDHVALCGLFGRMVDLPTRFPMFTNDIRQLYKRAGNPDMPKQESGLHNALADARFNVVRYNFLMNLLEPANDGLHCPGCGRAYDMTQYAPVTDIGCHAGYGGTGETYTQAYCLQTKRFV